MSEAPHRVGHPNSCRDVRCVDPDTCKFIVDRVVHPGGPFAFDRRRATDDFTLPSRLLTLEAISAVVIADTTVSVTKERSASWEGLRSQIGAEIRAHLETGRPAIAEPSPLRPR